ncbi:hypothetical protein GCM10009634_77450 [Saccharothrix xinjiangensis]
MLPSPSVHTVLGVSSGTALPSTRSSGTSTPPGGTGLSNSGCSGADVVGEADVVSVGPPSAPTGVGLDEAQPTSATSNAPAPTAVPRLLMCRGRNSLGAGLPGPFDSYPSG